MAYYRPPGVYPEKVPSAGLVSLWQGARIPVIVGRGQRTIEVMEVIASHTYGGTDTLSEDAVSIVRVGIYPDQIKYIQNTDFTFNAVTAPTSIVWGVGGGSEPASGATYFVTYMKSVDSDQYDYQMYTDENEIIRVHGAESTENLVTVGGVVALRQGCPAVGILQINLEDTPYPTPNPDDPTPAEYYYAFIAAVAKLELLDTDQCSVIVPMTTLDTVTYPILTEYLNHCYDMSLTSQRRWRTMICGRAASSAATNSTVRDAFVTQASGYEPHQASRRIALVAPGEIYRVLKDATTGIVTSTLFDGSVLSAAAAGRMCASPNPAESITMKDFGAVSLGRLFSNADMNIMAASGTCIFYYKGSILKCRHGITVDRTNANTQELSIVQIEDYVKIQSIFLLETRFVGTLFTEETQSSIRAAVIAQWEQMITAQIIYDFDAGSVSVSVDPNDPRTCNVFGRIKPMYTLNWIDVRFEFYTSMS